MRSPKEEQELLTLFILINFIRLFEQFTFFQIRLDYGGADVTQSFHYLLQRAGFPYKDCQPNHPLDGALLSRLKEGYCHLNLVRLCFRKVLQHSLT